MRRPVLGIVLTVQLVIGTSLPSIAQSPSPSLDRTPPPSGTEVGGRFVLPEGGYAMTFPEGWGVEVYPYDDIPRRIPYVEAREPRQDPAADDVSHCWVRVARPCVDDAARTCAALIDEAAAAEVSWWESGAGGLVPDTVESTAIALPAGYAVRVRMENADPERARSYYRITDGQALAILACSAAHGPDDHWLSIAETFEFLPVAD